MVAGKGCLRAMFEKRGAKTNHERARVKIEQTDQLIDAKPEDRGFRGLQQRRFPVSANPKPENGKQGRQEIRAALTKKNGQTIHDGLCPGTGMNPRENFYVQIRRHQGPQAAADIAVL